MKQDPISSEVYDDDWLTSAWGDKANKELFESNSITPRPRLARAFELANIQPGIKVLDIACGRAEMPLLCAEHGADAIGLDYSEAALKFANKLSQSKTKNSPLCSTFGLVRSDACILPFKDDSFDRITMLDIIEHLLPNQLESMFHEVHRVLKNDGYAVIHTLPNRWVYDITFPMLNLFSNKFPKNPRSESEKKIHINEQDLKKLFKTLCKCNLKNRLWLEQYIPAQARWNQGRDVYGDNRDSLYPAFAGFAGNLLEIISYTPFKLLLSNDIFGILWKNTKPESVKLPIALTERITCSFFSKQ